MDDFVVSILLVGPPYEFCYPEALTRLQNSVSRLPERIDDVRKDVSTLIIGFELFVGTPEVNFFCVLLLRSPTSGSLNREAWEIALQAGKMLIRRKRGPDSLVVLHGLTRRSLGFQSGM